MPRSDALPSWRSSPAKTAILSFLTRVTEGPDAVPASERVATFDNDGTLACEKPHTALAAFLEHSVAAAHEEPVPLGNGHEVLRAVGRLFEGLPTDEYERRARSFLAAGRHPRFGRPYPALGYAPMRELVDLLATLEFTVFLCSDSSRDFMRLVAGPAYGLAREQVIGSEVRIELNDGRLVRSATPVPLDDGPGKVVHIWDRTGRRPLLAAGNAFGDIEMLSSAQFAVLVHHDDAEREYAYDDGRALAAAESGGWTVVSMREDFARVWDDADHPDEHGPSGRVARGRSLR